MIHQFRLNFSYSIRANVCVCVCVYRWVKHECIASNVSGILKWCAKAHHHHRHSPPAAVVVEASSSPRRCRRLDARARLKAPTSRHSNREREYTPHHRRRGLQRTTPDIPPSWVMWRENFKNFKKYLIFIIIKRFSWIRLSGWNIDLK